MPTLLRDAGVAQVPRAATAVFVGTEFDSIRGRAGDDGSPKRMTCWGEIAFQLGGAQAFALVAAHDLQGEASGGDVIRDFLPQDRPALILMDELMNCISRSRKCGRSAQSYDFLHNLSETARGQRNVILVASITASELEMTAEGQSDYDRFTYAVARPRCRINPAPACVRVGAGGGSVGRVARRSRIAARPAAVAKGSTSAYGISTS